MKIVVYTDEKKQQEALKKIKSVIPDAYVIFDAGDKPKTADEMFKELGYEKYKPTIRDSINNLTKFYREGYKGEYIIYFNEISHYVFKSKEHPRTIFKIEALSYDEIKAIAKYIEEQEQ